VLLQRVGDHRLDELLLRLEVVVEGADRDVRSRARVRILRRVWRSAFGCGARLRMVSRPHAAYYEEIVNYVQIFSFWRV
jgi:hypothetical protein